MKNVDALRLVLEMAEQNLINEDETSKELLDEFDRQTDALFVVRELVEFLEPLS